MTQRLVVVLVFLLIAIPSIAQSTDTLRIYSTILKEEQEVWVTRTVTADTSKSLPLLICLDADALHQFTPVFVKYLSVPFEQSVPPMLIAGIRSKSAAWRRRNLIPHVDIDSLDRKPERGKADELLQFIETELLPRLQNTYRINNFRVLAGHSLGGLFTIYTLYKKPALFRGYLAISPSPVNGVITRSLIPAITAATPDSTLYLYVSAAGQDLTGYLDSTRRLKQMLEEGQPSHLKWLGEFFMDHTHWTTAPAATYNGLFWLFRNRELQYLKQ